MDFSKIDKNFAVQTKIDRTGLCFYDVEQAPFRIYGVKMENGCYRRLPEDVARSVSEGVTLLHTHTTGGRVRFVTDSPRIAIHAAMGGVEHSPHFALTGKCGFDIYPSRRYGRTSATSAT